MRSEASTESLAGLLHQINKMCHRESGSHAFLAELGDEGVLAVISIGSDRLRDEGYQQMAIDWILRVAVCRQQTLS